MDFSSLPPGSNLLLQPACSTRNLKRMHLNPGVRERRNQLQFTAQRLDVIAQGAHLQVLTTLQF